MSAIRIQITDVSGSRSCSVEAPDDVAVNRILVLLVERLNLPLNSPDGQIMSYKLHHRQSGRQLLDGQTLAEAAVRDGDELRLQPEITAGAGRRARD
ncbi:MAG: EsaB/YukD family protein [Kiritimatiellae bacterium]|nr:EsaB/YukD family protein [Kiritimatiellia bacterium]